MAKLQKTEQRYDSSERENRFDVSAVPISKIRTTAQGFLEIPAFLTRTGVLSYKRSDGSTVRELRLPEEVFSEDSLNSFMTAPVTEFHKGAINPSNVSEHQAGIVLGAVSRRGKFAAGKLLVQRGDTIAKVQNKELIELSPGYSCNIEVKSGVYEGERYDQIQRNIVNNHVALLPKGFGRSGSEVALRSDSAYSEIKFEEKAPEKAPKERTTMKFTQRLDGIDFPVELDDALAPAYKAAIAKAEQERLDAIAELAKKQGELDVATKNNEELQKRVDSATSPEALAKMVEARSELVVKAQKMAPELKTDGKDASEIHIGALEAKGWKRETLDGKDAAYIEGIFEAEARSASKPTPKGTPVGPTIGHQDASDESNKERTAAQARADMLDRQENAYRPKAVK